MCITGGQAARRGTGQPPGRVSNVTPRPSPPSAAAELLLEPPPLLHGGVGAARPRRTWWLASAPTSSSAPARPRGISSSTAARIFRRAGPACRAGASTGSPRWHPPVPGGPGAVRHRRPRSPRRRTRSRWTSPGPLRSHPARPRARSRSGCPRRLLLGRLPDSVWLVRRRPGTPRFRLPCKCQMESASPAVRVRADRARPDPARWCRCRRRERHSHLPRTAGRRRPGRGERRSRRRRHRKQGSASLLEVDSRFTCAGRSRTRACPVVP